MTNAQSRKSHRKSRIIIDKLAEAYNWIAGLSILNDNKAFLDDIKGVRWTGNSGNVFNNLFDVETKSSIGDGELGDPNDEKLGQLEKVLETAWVKTTWRQDTQQNIWQTNIKEMPVNGNLNIIICQN